MSYSTLMVDNRVSIPENQPETTFSSNKHQDFYLWLRSMPLEVLHDLYNHYHGRRTVAQGPHSNAFIPTPEYHDPHAPLVDKISLRRSVFVLIFNLIAIEFFFDLIYVVLKALPMYVQLGSDFIQMVTPVYFGLFLFLNVVKFILIIVVACKWVTNSYVITKGEIRYRSGVFARNEKIFMCSYTQEVTYSQGLVGRLCNFGSVEIHNPAIKEKIYLDSIPNPKKYVEIIKKNISFSPGGEFIVLGTPGSESAVTS